MNRSLLFIVFIAITYTASAQIPEVIDNKLEEVGTLNRKADSSYIRYFDEFGLHLYNVLYLNTFSLVDNNLNSTLEYAPLTSPAIGIGFTKYGLSVNLSQDFGVISQDKEKYGETKKFNINVSFLYKNMGFTGYFSKYDGYYIANPADFNIGWNEDIYPQRPDVQTLGYGLSYSHVFNKKKFSLNAAYTLTQKQLKSAGSIMTGVFVNGYHIKGDSSLIADTIAGQFNPHIAITNSDQYTFGFTAGYSYNFVFWKDFVFNITVLPGLLLSSSDSKTEDPNYSTNNFISVRPNIFYNSAISYVKSRYYIGLQASLSNYWINTGEDVGVNYRFLKAKLFIGYRLGSGKK